MKNIFVVTLGTREIQFLKTDIENSPFTIEKSEVRLFLKHPLIEKKIQVVENENFPDYLFPSIPRIAGEIMLEHIEEFNKIINFPLITASFEAIKKSNVIINEIVIVYTDQQDIKESKTHKRFYDKDTINYKEILVQYLWQKELIDKNCKLSSIGVTEKSTDIDYQYGQFGLKCKSIFESSDIKQIFLLAQGGIDQINHALTLQFIQAFGSKVKLWQQAEASEPKSLEFPFMFIRDLNKQIILKHLKDFDFGLISQLTFVQEPVRVNADNAHRMLNLDYSSLNGWEFFKVDSSESRAKDLFIACKLCYLKMDYATYLLKLFTLLENIYRIKVDKILGDTANHFKPLKNGEKNVEWLNLIKSISGLYEFLDAQKKTYKNKTSKKIESIKIDFSNPNRLTYKYIFEFLLNEHKLVMVNNDDEIEKLKLAFNLSEPLLNTRNDLAHKLKPISKEILNKIISEKNRNSLHKTFDIIFKITEDKPYGIYNDIRKEIENLL